MNIEFLHQKARVAITVNLSDDASFIGVFGASGAGKTTLLRCLAGLEESALGNADLVKINQRVGFVPHTPTLYPHLDVVENIALGKMYEKHSRFTVSEVISALHCEELLARSVTTLSAGEKQRVVLARTILNAPDVLLIDEALSSLQSTLKHKVLSYLKQLSRSGMKIVLVSHNLPDLFQCADALIELDSGQVVWSGEVSKIANRPIHENTSVDSIYSTVRQTDVQTGESIGETYAAVNAVDVILEVPPISQSSLLHCFHGTISSIKKLQGENLLVSVKNENEIIHAIVSTAACAKLQLKEQLEIAARF
ncbi:ATP-binding cassette domain-containing protein [Alteromonas ponticola]|uniref:ATP-binding cassette domain-containing protein n=1 Tax=Alteromonas ponticola TaxID=2720613 RepID=A0ABX1R554_9ALTE|nr:ATP-binding cassette domain-containing protein [Alteromonas ponticola]NMH61194.1 ATP-binding cassette domain-containing protein [Alteromonas ponticola]